MNRVIKILAAGSLPYSALIVMLGMAFYVGRDSAPATSKVVIAERSRVILEAVMDRPDMPKEKVAEEVLEPLKAILAHYQASGYVVLDTARDENGNYAVAALPNGARDITPELQKAVARVAEVLKMTEQAERKRKARGAWLVVIVAVLMAHFYWMGSPVMVGIDPHEDSCLPDMHAALMVKKQVVDVQRGDLLFWKPQGALAHVKQPYILKEVAGVPGDHLVVKDEQVFINGQLVAKGLPLLDTNKLSPKQFERDEVIPAGSVIHARDTPLEQRFALLGIPPDQSVTGKAWEIF